MSRNYHNDRRHFEVNSTAKQLQSIKISKTNDYFTGNKPQPINQEQFKYIPIQSEHVHDIGLYREYVQWDFINNKLYKSGEKLMRIDEKKKQEFTNTLQRWFIFINEHFNDVPKYPYYPILPEITSDHIAATFLREAIVEKKFVRPENAKGIVTGILNIIKKEHALVVPHNTSDPLTVTYNPNDMEVTVAKYNSHKVPRIKLLVDKGGLVAAAKMLLRYESFGNGSYQWGDPKEVHKILYDKFRVRYEGFASPVNSRFIEYKDTHFCSLFPETDIPFGSLGNFFHVDINDHVGGWSVNPPFLNDLMKNVAERIIQILDEGHRCYFFCTFPCWEDDEGWQLLNKSKYLRHRFDLKPMHFVVQDAYGRKFKPRMEMNLFVVGDLPDNVAKLTELGQKLIIDHSGSLPDDCPW